MTKSEPQQPSQPAILTAEEARAVTGGINPQPLPPHVPERM